MVIPAVGTLFGASIILFISAAAAALVFSHWQKLSNTASNILCMAASVSGIFASVRHLLSGGERLAIMSVDTTVPVISFNLTFDRLSAFFILGLCILVFCVSIYSIGYVSHFYGKRNVGLFQFLFSTFILSMFFVLTSSNAVFFYIAWEVMALLSYYLVVFESEHTEKQKAGMIYIIMTHIGAAFLMIAFMMMYAYTKSFELSGDSSAIPQPARNIMFILFLIGFGVKAGVIPLHIWLPYAHPAAPGNVSALMSGIMIKTAVYGLLRFVLVYLGVDNTWWGMTLLILGMVSAVLGVAYAFVEVNIKKLLAYSSIENIGIIFIGLGIAFIAFAKGSQTIGALALCAALFHTLNHTLFKGGLFLGAGSIQHSTHTLEMEQLGGLIKKMPVTAVFMLGGSLAISSVVPFNGFASEWLTLQSIFGTIGKGQAVLNIAAIVAVAALAIAGALAAASFVKLFGISFLGLGRTEHAAHAREVSPVMYTGMGLLIVPCLILGVFPSLFLKLTDGLVTELAGKSIACHLEGLFMLADYPAAATGNSISPLQIIAALTALLILTFIVLRLVGGKYLERKYGTWDCGFEALNSRMQYTATGFSKPVQIVFRILFRPSRELKIGGNYQYHPESMEYTTSTEPIFEKYVYAPVVKMITDLSRRMKFAVQTGSVHRYLIYIFVAVLALMLYNRIA